MPTDPAESEAPSAAAVLRAVASDDLAEHHEIVDPGPDPATRAVVGLLLGAAVGAVAAILSRRGS